MYLTDVWGGIEHLKLAVYYASYLYFPAAIFLIFLIVRKRLAAKLIAGAVLLALSVFAYARFIEPRILLAIEHETTLSRCFPQAGAVRIAIFSDTHEGLFGNVMPIARIAQKVNKTHPDAVFIAGDFVYFLSPQRYGETFAALGEITAPVYAVLGNHDVGLPGPDVSRELTAALEAAGVHVIDDKAQTVSLAGAEVDIVGLSDLWAKRQQRALLERRGDRPLLALTHNPGTILELRPREAVDLLFAGHTHGGQINIPGVTCALAPFACRVARYGFADAERGRVFVTSGTGMVGLPMRFNAAPRVDAVNVAWRACD